MPKCLNSVFVLVERFFLFLLQNEPLTYIFIFGCHVPGEVFRNYDYWGGGGGRKVRRESEIQHSDDFLWKVRRESEIQHSDDLLWKVRRESEIQHSEDLKEPRRESEIQHSEDFEGTQARILNPAH